MHPIRIALALVLFFLTSSASSQNPSYTLVGKQPTKGTITTNYYRFNHISPSSIYSHLYWTRYANSNNDRDIVLHMGAPIVDTLVLDVRSKRQIQKVENAWTYTDSNYSKVKFQPVPGKEYCVMSDPEKPFQLKKILVAFLAVCVNPATQEVYELWLSWRTARLLQGSLDELMAQDKVCMSAQEPRKRPCRDSVGEMSAAMNVFVSSFSFIEPNTTVEKQTSSK